MTREYIDGLRAAAAAACFRCGSGEVPVRTPCQVVAPKAIADYNKPNRLIPSFMWVHPDPSGNPLDRPYCNGSPVYEKYPEAVPTTPR